MQSDLILFDVPGPQVREWLNWFAEAIVTNQSGPTEPPNPKPFQFWADTANGLLKQRNGDNSAWLTVGAPDVPNLGLATLGANVFTGTQDFARNVLQRPRLRNYGETVNVLGSISGAVEIDLSAGNIVTATVAGDVALSFTGALPGMAHSLTLFLTNGGAHSVTWPDGTKWPLAVRLAGGGAPVLAMMGLDIVTLMTVDGGASWVGMPTELRQAPKKTFPVVVDVTESSFAAGIQSHPVAMPATVAPGQLLLVPMTFERVGSSFAPSITTPPGWTLLWTKALGNGTAARFAGYGRVADGSEGGTTVDFVTSNGANGAAQVHRIDDWFGTLDGVAISNVVTGGNDSPNGPSLTVPWGTAKNTWLSIFGSADDDVAVESYPAGYSGGVNTLSAAPINDGAAVASARREREAATENPSAFDLNGTDAWGAVTVAVRPAV